MRTCVILLALACSAFVVRCVPAADAERIEPEMARQIGELAMRGVANLPDLPLKIDPDLDRCTGLRAEKRGGLVVPHKSLTAEMLAAADKEVVPVGYLLLHRIAPIVIDQPVRIEDQRTVEIMIKDETVKLPVMQLGVTKVAGKLVLLVYTNAKSPAIVTTLVENAEGKDYPLDLDARPSGGDNRATVVITILSRYRAAIEVAGEE